MTNTGPIAGRWTKTLAYFASFVALGLALAALGPTLPCLADLAGVSLSSLSTIFIARSGGYLAGAVTGGRLYDRIPGHVVLGTVIAVMALCLALVPFGRSLPLLALILFILGWGEGGVDVGGNTLLVWLYPCGLSPWMHALHFFFGVGALVSPLIVAYTMESHGSIASVYWLLAVLLLPISLVILIQPSPPIAEHAKDRTASLAGHRTSLLFIGGLLFAAAGAEIGFGSWIYTFAIRLQLTDALSAAVLTSTYWTAFTIGRLFGIPLSARLSPPAILLLCGAGCGTGVLSLWIRPDAALWAGTVVAGFAVGPMFASIVALAELTMPISGRSTGWFLVGSSAGAMSVPWIIGQFFETAGPQVTWVVILLDLCLGFGIYAIFEIRNRKITDLPGARR